MCVAMPYRVLEVNNNGRAQIDVGGTRQEISVMAVPEVQAGDYVLVYLGFAINKIEWSEAMEVLRLYQEMAEAECVPTGPPPDKKE